jgi:hypothetical protein
MATGHFADQDRTDALGQLRTFRQCSPESWRSGPTTQARAPRLAADGHRPDAQRGRRRVHRRSGGKSACVRCRNRQGAVKTPTRGPIGGAITTYNFKRKQHVYGIGLPTNSAPSGRQQVTPASPNHLGATAATGALETNAFTWAISARVDPAPLSVDLSSAA